MSTTLLEIMFIVFLKPNRTYSNAVNFVMMEQYRSNSLLDIINDNTSQAILESFSIALKSEKEIWKSYSTITVQNTDSTRDASFHVSEVSLRNRWKTGKWRFSQTVAILSESLEFAKKGFLVYGPNCSENASIFFITSKTSFDAQNGTIKFQRDIVYRKMYPKLNLITYGRFGCAVQVICILCPNALSPPTIVISDDLQEISSASIAMNSLHQEFNIGKGYGSVALLCYIGPRGQIRSVAYHKQLELTARRRFDRTADKVGVMLGILINRFNFSIENENFTELQGNYSGIYLNPGGDMPVDYIYGRHLTLAYIISEFLMYCRKVPIISSTGWDFLWAPLDYATWGLAFLTGILFSLYHRGQISYGFDVFWAILSIPPTSDWARSKVLSCSLVVLLNINVGYLSVITSKVIIPNREADIETPSELFRQGFRFVDSNISLAGPGFIGYWRKALEAVNINASVMSNVIVQVDSTCGKTHEPHCIAHWASLATGVLYLHEKIEKLLSIPEDMRDKCHGVKKPLRTYWVSFYSQGPLSSAIYDTYQALTATGIDSFWEKLRKTSSVYDAYRKANHTKTDGPPKLNFKTPILVVFKAYGVLIAICIMSFPIEWLYHYIRNGRNGTTQIIKQNKYATLIRKSLLSCLMHVCGVAERPEKIEPPRIILVSNFSNDSKHKVKPRVEVILW